MARIVVAMSGGVDSSVAAVILKQQGHEVIGMMLRLWSEPDREAVNRCCSPDSLSMARRVAARLDIPFYTVDAQQLFRDVVVGYFLDGYSQGITPNPCLPCNRYIRWDFLLHKALNAGAEYLATGHYARVREVGGKWQLLRGLDSQKDQSYVLSVLTQNKLRYAMFPLGSYTKLQVRELARNFGLPVADRAESQDLCFLGKEDYRDFLRRYKPEVVNPGPIITRQGQEVGKHNGLAFYTIGQRRGLGISSPVPLYVQAKDLTKNALVIGTADELGDLELDAIDVNWISGDAPTIPIRVNIKIRYKSLDAWGIVTPIDERRVHIQFEHPMRDITPGQLAVLYDGEICLGSGTIEI